MPHLNYFICWVIQRNRPLWVCEFPTQLYLNLSLFVCHSYVLLLLLRSLLFEYYIQFLSTNLCMELGCFSSNLHVWHSLLCCFYYWGLKIFWIAENFQIASWFLYVYQMLICIPNQVIDNSNLLTPEKVYMRWLIFRC